MTIKDIENKLINQIAAILSCSSLSIKPDAQLHTLGVDSLSFVEILVFIEKEFKIKLIESGLDKEDFKSVRSLAARINKTLK
jgi:acyl carrier protein